MPSMTNSSGEHRFFVGDRVRCRPDEVNRMVRSGSYVITQCLPAADQGGEAQYRAKSDLDAHERVLDSSQLILIAR